MLNYQCLSMINFDSKSFIGMLTLTDQRLIFTSSVTITIEYGNITTYTMCSKGIKVDHILIYAVFKNRLFNELLKRFDTFKMCGSPNSSRDRSLTLSSSRSRSSRISSTSRKSSVDSNHDAERYTWMKLLKKNIVNMDILEFFNELQANPPIIMMPLLDDTNSNIGRSVVFSKAKWISLTQLLHSKNITKNIGYNIHGTTGPAQDVVITMTYKYTLDSKLIILLNYELPSKTNGSKLKVFIRLKAQEISKKKLKIKVEYDVEFGDITSIDQLRAKLDIEHQIKEHFKHVFIFENTNIEKTPVNTPSSLSVVSTTPYWIPHIRKLEMQQGMLLILWLVTVTGLLLSIIAQKDLKKR